MRIFSFFTGVFRLGLALVFGYAGYQKLRAPGATDEFLTAFLRIDLPHLGFVIGVGESIHALLLFLNAGPRLTARVAVLASAAFVTVHVYALTLPEPPPPCGCLGAGRPVDPILETPFTWLWFTVGMLAASSFLLWQSPSRAERRTPDPNLDPAPEGVPA